MNQSNDASMVDNNTLLACVRAGGETGDLASAEIKRRLARTKQPDEAAVEARIERVARALCVHDGYDPNHLAPGDFPVVDGHNAKGEPCHFFWRDYRSAALAALQADEEALAREG